MPQSECLGNREQGFCRCPLFAFLDLGQVGIRKTGKPGELLSFEPLLGSGNLDRLTQAYDSVLVRNMPATAINML